MAAGDGFSPEQRERLEHALAAAVRQTAMPFWVRVGGLRGGDPRLEAERLLVNLVDAPRDPGVLILVGPEERCVEVMTTPGARHRLDDQSVGLAILTMTSSFAVGDLMGGLVNGIRQLADGAGRVPEATPRQVGLASTRLSHSDGLSEGTIEMRGDDVMGRPDDFSRGEPVQRQIPGSAAAPGRVSTASGGSPTSED